jgi:2-dehydropantoate 2-reductase
LGPLQRSVLVAGTGPVGSMFGCLLRKAGHDVTLLGREWHLDAVRSGGLAMDGLWGTHHADGFHLVSRPDDLNGPYDLVLIAVKSYDTVAMVDATAPFLSPGGLAVSLQNGLGNIEAMARRFGPTRSLGASILVGARIPKPGNVTVTVQAAPIVIGPLEAASSAMAQCRALCELLGEAGITTETTDRVESHLWAKVFYNAPLNPLGALLGVRYGVLAEVPELKSIMDRIIEEAFEVAQRKRVDPLWRSAAAYKKEFYGKLLPATYDHESSMLQDLERGRRTEIGALNGRIWRYGREVGLPAPFNEAMTRLMWGRETPRKPPGHS